MSPHEKQFSISNGSIQTGITRQGAFEPLAFFVAVGWYVVINVSSME
jgi:hypothetical protein